MKTKILGTGLTGLVGSRIMELLGDEYDFEKVSYEDGVDITNKDQVEKAILESETEIVLHLAAKTDVDGCEEDKTLGIEGAAWQINVAGTQNIVEACKKTGKKIIYISTDFVFDGNKDFYTEEDLPNPINWYAQTKYEGEKIVQRSGLTYLICRIAFPYRAQFSVKKDFMAAIREKLEKGEEISVVEDEIVTPTFVDDLAYALDFLIKKEAVGFYHVVGSSFHTPVEAAQLVAKTFDLDISLINKISRKEYYQNRAPRPFSLRLKNDKLTKLGFKMKTFSQGLKIIKGQISKS